LNDDLMVPGLGQFAYGFRRGCDARFAGVGFGRNADVPVKAITIKSVKLLPEPAK